MMAGFTVSDGSACLALTRVIRFPPFGNGLVLPSGNRIDTSGVQPIPNKRKSQHTWTANRRILFAAPLLS